jgi:hypothetical protein
LMNELKTKLKENWEYVGYDLHYWKFKAQANVYLKNKWHALKLLTEASEPRLDECVEEHWENMKRIISSKAKQSEISRNRAMQALFSTPSHSSCGGEVGIVGRLVRKWVQSWTVFIYSNKCCTLNCTCMWGFVGGMLYVGKWTRIAPYTSWGESWVGKR